MALSLEDIERSRIKADQEEKARLEAEAKQRALQQQRQKAQRAAAPSQAKPQNNRSAQIRQAAMTAKPQQRQSGLLTQIGQAVDSAISGDWMSDAANGIAAGINQITPDNSPIKGFTQGLDDNVRSSAELDAIKVKRSKQAAQSSNPVERALNSTANNLEAVSEGMQAGINIPSTVAARIANQDNPWSDPPAIIKDSPIGETLFEVAQVLTPTLFGGAVLGGYGRGAIASSIPGLAAESALETSTQDSFDDLIVGRTLATKFGEIADHLGYDGEALARELVEGKTVNSQVLTAVTGFVQNFGINFGADRLVHFFGTRASKALRNITPTGEDRAAQILGSNSDKVDNAVHNVNNAPYTKDLEPHEALDIDNAVPVSKPSPGSEALSKEAFVREAVRPSAGEDGLTNAGRSYFTNWGAVVDDNSLQRVLQEATSTLKRLKNYPEDMKGVLARASDWWDNNRQLFNDDISKIDSAALNFQDLTKTLEGKEGLKALLGNKVELDTYLREYAATTEEGFIAASLVGEELGVRIQKLAMQAVNLEDNNISFNAAIENILQLHDKAQLFLIPLRRGKRKWAVEGALQQRRTLSRLKDADIKGALSKADPLSSDAPARSFETIKVDDADPGSTLRELWDKYKEGDDAAGATLKRYLNLIAYSDPSTAVSQVSGLNNVLRDALKKGNSEAATNLFYFSMLSRAATQTASAASNFARLIAEPIGAVLSKEKAYGLGQIVGGWQGLSESHKVFKKALFQGIATNGGAKIEEAVKDLAKEQVALDNLYEGAIKELNAAGVTGMSQWGAHISHWFQSAANHPLVHLPGRLLLAGDEWTKSVVANQIAVGRAYQEIAQLGITDAAQKQRIINAHISKVFRDSDKSGKIIDADVLSVAQHLTFQSAIPDSGNAIDAAFHAVNEAANSSGFWKFVSPFTKVSYNVLETTARFEPTGVFRNLVPKYRQILDGKFGETAQLQLKSQIRFGQAWSSMVTLAAASGFVTGVNSGNKPKQSFLIPANNEKGYIAVPYGKLEPFATITSVIADTVNGVRDEVISEGAYEKFVSNMVFSLGMASFDKTFLTGMADFGSMFDAKNLSSGSLTGVANSAAIVSPGIVRMVSSWAYPYKTITGMDANAWENFVGSWRARAIGGIGNPILYDELTGKPIPTVATAGKGDNYWALVAGSVLNEFIYPGKITKADRDDPVRNELDAVNFKHDAYSSIRTYNGIALTPTQQSILSKDINDFGNLRGKLLGYFESDQYKTLKRQLNAMRRADNPVFGSSDEGTRAGAIRDVIHQDLRNIWRGAKEEAIRDGRLHNDGEFLLKLQSADSLSSFQPQPQVGGALNNLLSLVNK